MGRNPNKACPPGSFEVSTYKLVTVNGVTTPYPIDYKQFMAGDSALTVFAPVASTLPGEISKYDNSISSQVTSYTFLLRS